MRDCANSPLAPNLTSPTHGLEGVGADVVAELGVVEALGRYDCLLEDLELGVGPRHHVIAERINAFDRRARLVFLHQSSTPANCIFGTGSQ